MGRTSALTALLQANYPPNGKAVQLFVQRQVVWQDALASFHYSIDEPSGPPIAGRFQRYGIATAPQSVRRQSSEQGAIGLAHSELGSLSQLHQVMRDAKELLDLPRNRGPCAI